jgi:hypothetical protein
MHDFHRSSTDKREITKYVNNKRANLLTLVDKEIRRNETQVKINSVSMKDHIRLYTQEMQLVRLPSSIIFSPAKRSQISFSAKKISFNLLENSKRRSNKNIPSFLSTFNNLIDIKDEVIQRNSKTSLKLNYFNNETPLQHSSRLSKNHKLLSQLFKSENYDKERAYDAHQKLKIKAFSLKANNFTINDPLCTRKKKESCCNFKLDVSTDLNSKTLSKKSSEEYLFSQENQVNYDTDDNNNSFESEATYLSESSQTSRNSLNDKNVKILTKTAKQRRSKLFDLIPCEEEEELKSPIFIKNNYRSTNIKKLKDKTKSQKIPEFNIKLLKC